MDFGVHLANWGLAASSERVAGLARAAEDLGFDSVWVTDHVVIPDTFESKYPYPGVVINPDTAQMTFEPLITLAVVAGQTRRIRIGTSALISPQREALLTVKQLTTLDVLSGGRLDVGVGAGWLREEYALLGASFEDRGRMLDEQLELFHMFWNEEIPRFKGRFLDLPAVRFQPRPMQPGGPPITVGGSSAAALRRAAREDGWQPVSLTPEELVEPLAELARLRVEAGNPKPPQILLRCPAEVLDEDIGGAPPLVGTPARIRDGVRRYQEVGVTGLLMAVVPAKPLEVGLRTLERWAAEVMPAFRAGEGNR